MRPCDETLALISAALDGTLSSEEQSALDAHLALCPACSALYTDLIALHTISSELEEIPAPEGFAANIMAQIAADPSQENTDNIIVLPTTKPKHSPWKGWTATAAAVVIVALGAVTLSGQFGATKNAAFDAAPAQAESALTMDTCDDVQFQYVEKALLDPDSDAVNTATEYSVSADTVNTPASLDQNASSSSAPKQNAGMMPSPTAESDSSESIDPYCGILTVATDALPDGLDKYEFETMNDGTLHYVVPAEYFFSLEGTEDFRAGAAEKNTQIPEYGLIIVKPVS